MLKNQTVEKLRDMKLKTMAQMFCESNPAYLELSFEERFGLMVEKEWMAKKNSKIKHLLKNANLGLNACIEDICLKSYTLEESRDILEIAESRYNIGSTILAGQIAIANGMNFFLTSLLLMQ